MSRPAETLTFTGGIALLVAKLVGLSDDLVGPIGIGLAAVPAAVTYVVTHGGVKGLVLSVWHGAKKPDAPSA